jgi:hypothetical protein
MKRQHLNFWIIIIVIVLLSGCTQEVKNIVKCEPNWILASEITNEEYCKSACYNAYKVNSYKIEETQFYECDCITTMNMSAMSWIDKNGDCQSYCEGNYKNVIKSWTGDIYGDSVKCYCNYSLERTRAVTTHYTLKQEDCLNDCKQTYETESDKLINVTSQKVPSSMLNFKCYCDVNNCNPK